MNNTLTIPQLNYIVFEIVKINVDKYINNQNFKAEQVDTICLATLPEQFSYRLASRDSLTQTQNKVFLQKYSLAPEECKISGSFGNMPRLIGTTLMDGWARLQQFYSEVVKLVKDTSDDQNIYALNYYDFWWQRFGSINIDLFQVTGNAREHATLPKYSCDFKLIGDLIDANGTDPLLAGLKILFAPSGVVGDVVGGVNSFLSTIQPILNYAGLGYEGLKTVSNLVDDSMSAVSGYTSASNQIYKNVASIF